SLLSLAAALVVHSFPTRRSSDLALAPGLLRCEAFADPQGRRHCGQSDGRCQRLNPDAAAGALPADVCQFRRLAACVELYLYQPGGIRCRGAGAVGPEKEDWCGEGLSLVAEEGPDP